MQTHEAQPLRDLRIVVVDDEELTRTVVARRLKQWGFEPLTFAEPRPALRLLARGEASALITDLDMPEIDGLAFARAVRRLRPHLPVVLMTGSADPDLRLRARAHGIDAIVTKRADFHGELHDALRGALPAHTSVAEPTDAGPRADVVPRADAAPFADPELPSDAMRQATPSAAPELPSDVMRQATPFGDVELAHSLRTPLTALKSAIDILCTGSLPHEQGRLAAIAQRNADQMILVIERLLERSTAKP